jgi:hypothetical protein
MAEAGTVFTPVTVKLTILWYIYTNIGGTHCLCLYGRSRYSIHTSNCEADRPLVHIYQQLEEPTVCVFMAEVGTVFTPVTVKLRILWYIYTNSWRNPLSVFMAEAGTVSCAGDVSGMADKAPQDFILF